VPARRGLYAGDDTTDLDAFQGLAAAGLAQAVRIAVESVEGPPELAAAADMTVPSPEALGLLLATL
jgi:trehalose-6-phosphatase